MINHMKILIFLGLKKKRKKREKKLSYVSSEKHTESKLPEIHFEETHPACFKAIVSKSIIFGWNLMYKETRATNMRNFLCFLFSPWSHFFLQSLQPLCHYLAPKATLKSHPKQHRKIYTLLHIL